MVRNTQNLAETCLYLATSVTAFGKTTSKIVACLEEGFEDALSVLMLPKNTASKHGLRTCRGA